MIVTHNFMHLFPAPKENEFAFYPDRFSDFIRLMLGEPENSLRIVLSFVGHFGVQIFIFLSAYGLVKKYSSQNLSYGSYLWQRFLKIYPTFILAIAAWLMVSGWVSGDHGVLGPLKELYWNFDKLLLNVFLLSNLPGGAPLSPVGPWWFIPFIFQFYLVFPVLLYLYRRFGNSALLLLSIVGVIVSILSRGKIGDFNLYFTVLGHLPEFCLGIYLAKKDAAVIRIPPMLVVSALSIYLLGNLYEIFWYVSHISFLILLLTAFGFVVPKIKSNNSWRGIFLFFGTLSMPLFLVNGFLREPFITWAIDYNHWLLTIAMCLLSLMVSTLVAMTLSIAEKRLMSKVHTEDPITLYRQLNRYLTSRP